MKIWSGYSPMGGLCNGDGGDDYDDCDDSKEDDELRVA